MATTHTSTTQPAPAERLVDGVGRQIVNQYDLDGRFVRQVSYRGTELQARAYAALQFTHDTDPAYAALLATLRNG